MMSENAPHEAKWWKKTEDGKIQCFLCPRLCVIAEHKSGFCAVRKNIGGVLTAFTYGHPVALQVDPIEKKPLKEFMPGTRTFSFGTYGCNLDCAFCQNHLLSRGAYEDGVALDFFPPEKIVQLAIEQKCESISFTYNEPTIFAEYAIDVATLAHEKGLATVLVSNGYITLEAAKDLYPLIDAANIDMKGFSEDFYKDLTKSRLRPVLDMIEYFYSLGGHLELTNLVIPGKNDSPEMIEGYLDWVGERLSERVPLHFSAYHPAHRYDESPRTSAESLYQIRETAIIKGFSSVYLGNIG